MEEFVRHDADLLPEAARFVGGAVWPRVARGGHVVLDPADGTELGRVDTGRPAADGVVDSGGEFVVAGENGLLLRVRADGTVMDRARAAGRIGALRRLGEGEALITTKGTLKAVAL
ncbi:hypothetical protein [Streptomyces sp. NPDC020141]|uniref:hypothetical protein n=1 Tax=Streptomyces sp. NPDC020141 TaxID=3365065 RepID=UPI00379F11F8